MGFIRQEHGQPGGTLGHLQYLQLREVGGNASVLVGHPLVQNMGAQDSLYVLVGAGPDRVAI